MHYVLDEGSLLQRTTNGHGRTQLIISVGYIWTKRYSKSIIVFDGYSEDPITEDITHLCRTIGCSGPRVHFSGQTVISLKKNQFLS